mgnify:FL=1
MGKKPTPRNGNIRPIQARALDRFLVQTADGAFAIDHRHRIVFWNKACERIFGLDPRSVLGKPCWEVVGGEDRYGNPICLSRCVISAAARQGRLVKSFEMRILRKGEPVWISASTLFVQGHQKGLSTAVHLVRETWDPRGFEGYLQDLLARLEKHPLAEKEPPVAKAPPRLSPRESEVLSCLSRGQHAKDIARQLGVSPSTVRSHVKTILGKLEVHSQLEAVAYAFQHNQL